MVSVYIANVFWMEAMNLWDSFQKEYQQYIFQIKKTNVADCSIRLPM